MLIFRRIRQQRANLVFVVIVLGCLVALSTGVRSSKVTDFVRRGGSIVIYPFQKGIHSIVKGVHYMNLLFVSVHETQKELERLQLRLGENLIDEAIVRELRQENRRLREMLAFQRGESRFVLLPASVIGKFEGTLIIDRGSLHGISELMCVITPEGLVGTVVKVFPFQSYVYTLHHADCRVGAMIMRNRATGMIHGSGSDFTYICRMEYIDMKDTVQIGDVIVTSGGPVFPSGIPIGRVVSCSGEGALLQTAIVEPFVDVYNVFEVFVVKGYFRTPDEKISGNLFVREPLTDTLLPDLRTIQEQFAP